MVSTLTDEMDGFRQVFESLERRAILTTALPPSPKPEFPDWITGRTVRRILPDIDRQREHVFAPAREAFLRCVKAGTGWPLFFYGLQGRGKTTAALWFLDHVVKPFYCTSREIVDYEFCPDWRRKDDFREAWKRSSLCVVDQFGMSGKQGPGQTQAIVDCLDKRTGRPLIIISNLMPGDIDDVFDAQVRSRIEYGTKIEFKGLPDYRVLAGKARG